MTGSLLYIVNSLSMLVLFVWANVAVFKQGHAECEQASRDSQFSVLFQVLRTWVIVQYVKLFLLLAGSIIGTCCLRSKYEF